MKTYLIATAAAVLMLTVTATAPAQQFGGSYYSVPAVQYYQPVYPSYYAQPQIGGSFNYATPSFGFGINIGPSYGSNFGYYSRPSYYPPRHHHHHHGHHHHHHGHHHHGHHHHGHR